MTHNSWHGILLLSKARQIQIGIFILTFSTLKTFASTTRWVRYFKLFVNFWFSRKKLASISSHFKNCPKSLLKGCVNSWLLSYPNFCWNWNIETKASKKGYSMKKNWQLAYNNLRRLDLFKNEYVFYSFVHKYHKILPLSKFERMVLFSIRFILVVNFSNF